MAEQKQNSHPFSLRTEGIEDLNQKAGGQIKQAEELAEKLVGKLLAKALTTTKEKRVLKEIAYMLERCKNDVLVKELFDKLLTATQKIRDKDTRADTLQEIAYSVSGCGWCPKPNEQRVKELTGKVVSAMEKIKNYDDDAHYSCLVYLYCTLLNWDKALSTAERIKDIRRKVDELAYIAEDIAQIDVERALDIAEKIDDACEKARTVCKLAHIFVDTDEHRAKELFIRAENIAQKIKSEHNRVYLLSRIAQEIAEIDPNRSKKLFSEAIRITGKITQRKPTHLF